MSNKKISKNRSLEEDKIKQKFSKLNFRRKKMQIYEEESKEDLNYEKYTTCRYKSKGRESA